MLSVWKYKLLNLCNIPFFKFFLFKKFCGSRYRLRSKVEIENVVEEYSCWQRYGGKLSEKSSSTEEPEAASVGWGAAVDRSGESASRGGNCGWQWFKDPRLDSLGFRGIFPSNIIRKFYKLVLLLRSVYVYSITMRPM